MLSCITQSIFFLFWIVGCSINCIEMGLLYSWWMLRKSWSEIRSVHGDISRCGEFFSIFIIKIMVALLDIFHLWMRVSGCPQHILTNFIKWSRHLRYWRLLLAIGILCFHDADFFVLYKWIITRPSSRMILPVVYHLFLLYNLGNCLWKPVLSKQVIPSSLSLTWHDWMMYFFLLLFSEGLFRI